MLEASYTYDDVVLLPQYSGLDSRSTVSIATKLSLISLELPIISSPMDTVTGAEMACWMGMRGGLGIIHRYNTIEEQVELVNRTRQLATPKKTLLGGMPSRSIGAAIGVNGDSWERAQALVDAGVNLLCIDVAHGHTKATGEQLRRIADKYPNIEIMSGNICTTEAAKFSEGNGATVLRVGVGGGSVCTTREVAGVGLGQLSAIMEIAEVAKQPIVADGGVRKSGDIVKAFAAGADAVILGNLLSNYPISAAPIVGDQKIFRGMASDSALSEYKGPTAEYVVEGEHCFVNIDHDYDNTFNTLLKGIRTGLSYLGAQNLEELRAKASFRTVTNNGLREGRPHKLFE